jgi:uncharacterized membrane protein
MDLTHRAKKSDLYLYWGSLIFWSAIAVFIFSFSPPEPREGEHWSQFVGQFLIALFLLFLILLSIGGILYNKRHYYHIADNAVETRDILRRKSLDFGEVTEVLWGETQQRGNVELITPRARISVNIAEFPKAEARKLILFLRDRWPESIQKDWDRFWEASWRTFEEEEEIDPAEIAATRRASLRLMLGWFAVAWLILAAGDFFAWRYTGELWWLCQPLVVLIFLLFICLIPRSYVPKTKGKLSRHQPMPKLSALHTACILLAVISPIAIMGLKIFPRGSLQEGVFSILPMLVLIVPVFVTLGKHKKTYQQWNREAAKTAAELYLKPPDAEKADNS